MTFVPNLQSALVDKLGKVIPPWNSFFQQFTQLAPAAQPVIGASPLIYTTNVPGNLIIPNGTISNITLTRGLANFNLTGLKVIPMGIGDTVTITYSVAPSVDFLG